jgi:hypothetical protein
MKTRVSLIGGRTNYLLSEGGGSKLHHPMHMLDFSILLLTSYLNQTGSALINGSNLGF